MKIITVTEKQFEQVWSKMTPMQRVSSSGTARHVFLYPQNAMIVVGVDVEVGSIEDQELAEGWRLSELFAMVDGVATRKIEVA